MDKNTSYQALLDTATTTLYQQSESPRIDAEILLLHVIDKSLSWLIAYGDTVATRQHSVDFQRLIEQRLQGQPIAYLTGHKEFWSLDLMVNAAVLIPRPDTEILVEQAIVRLEINTASTVLDLGTGSGAIALAIAKERPAASVLAVDTQPAALALAQQNARKNELSNIGFLKSNWFEKIDTQAFDLIASNPPYIEPNDPHLTQGDLRFEPTSALIGAGDGLDDIRQIIQQAPNFLKPGGHLLIEHGYNQSEQVADCFITAGFSKVVNYQDLNHLPRCTAGVLDFIR